MEEIMAFKLTGVGDPHVHFRQNERVKDGVEEETAMLDFAVEASSWASFALPMPNTVPSIRTGKQAIEYENQILETADEKMHIIKCIKAIEGFTTPEIIREAKEAGVEAIKIYFEGVTTNAFAGDAVSWKGLLDMKDVWQTCQEVDMVVCVHPEKPGEFSLYREKEAHSAIRWLHKTCPDMRLCVEHVTDRRTLKLVRKLPDNVRCTITAHHLWGDLDMVIGGNLDPHSFCKPPAKLPPDLVALLEAAKSGDPKFMFGSDTAPHSLEDKCHEGCAGCFTGPFCLQLVAHVLEQANCDNLPSIMQGFMADFAREFYRIPASDRTVTLERIPFEITSIMHTKKGVPVVPFMAGQTLNWSIV